MVAEFGAETAPDEVDVGRFAEWFESSGEGEVGVAVGVADEGAGEVADDV